MPVTAHPEDGGEMARRTADARADVEDVRAGREGEVLGEGGRRRAPAGVEFVGRGKVCPLEMLGILALFDESLDDRLFEAGAPIVGGDQIFSAHGVPRRSALRSAG